MLVYVVIALHSGVVNEVSAFANPLRAKEERDKLNQEYGIERDKDGDYEHPENDVLSYALDLL